MINFIMFSSLFRILSVWVAELIFVIADGENDLRHDCEVVSYDKLNLLLVEKKTMCVF